MAGSKKDNIHSIALYFVWVLMLGLLVPMAAGMVITMNQARTDLEKALDTFHRESLKVFGENIKDTLVSFSPEGVRRTASLLFKDDRIVSIEVFSDIYDIHLLRVSKQTSTHRYHTKSLTRILKRGDEVLGCVQIEVDKDWILPRLKEKRDHSIIFFSAMFAGGLILILPAIYFKILIPLHRLADQAMLLSRGELDQPCRWKGRDELSMLGRTLDEMRRRLRQSFQLMKAQAVTDELTGLPNRRGFALEVDKLIHMNARYGHTFCLAMVDLDHFKKVNDTHGHMVGDQVLKTFVDNVRLGIRKTDFFARIGGEEFILVMPETSLSDAEYLLNKIRKTVCSKAYPHGSPLTVSAGAAEYTGTQSLDRLIAVADKALYQAKELGRNRVVACSQA